MKEVLRIIVIGAGPSGSAVSFYLAKAGFDVLLLDKAEFPREKTCGDGLTPRALAVLDDMGVLPELEGQGRKIDEIDIVAPNGRLANVDLSKNFGFPNYSLILPRLELDEVLLKHAIRAGVQFQGSMRVNDVRNLGDRVEVCCGEKSFAGELAIVATGANMGLLGKLGIDVHKEDVLLAVRAYYESLRGLRKQMQFRCDNVELPAYGWIFPISDSSANVGIISFATDAASKEQKQLKKSMQRFIQSSALRDCFSEARQIGPIHGFPIRADFAKSTTYKERMLFLGEAAGLANPLTGEGIDYALESAQIAANFIVRHRDEDFWTQQCLREYDLLLREKYQRLFTFSKMLRDTIFKRVPLNLLVKMAVSRPVMLDGLANVLLGNEAAPKKLSPKIIWQTVLGRPK